MLTRMELYISSCPLKREFITNLKEEENNTVGF